MSIAHPWLEQEPWPTEQMSKDLLESRIERVLTMTNIGCLGTVSKSGGDCKVDARFVECRQEIVCRFIPQHSDYQSHWIMRFPL